MFFISHALSDQNKTSITHLPLSAAISLDHHKMEKALREVAAVVVVADEERDETIASQVGGAERLGTEVAQEPLGEVERERTRDLEDSPDASQSVSRHGEVDEGGEAREAAPSMLRPTGSGESPSFDGLEAVYGGQELQKLPTPFNYPLIKVKRSNIVSGPELPEILPAAEASSMKDGS